MLAVSPLFHSIFLAAPKLTESGNIFFVGFSLHEIMYECKLLIIIYWAETKGKNQKRKKAVTKIGHGQAAVGRRRMWSGPNSYM